MADTDGGPGTIASILANLRNIPLWVFAGLAVAGYTVLFAAPANGVNISAFRHQWGAWVWIEAVAFSALALAKATDLIASHAWVIRTKQMDRPLRLVLRYSGRRWYLARQPDGSFITQISLDVDVTNLTDHPVRLVATRLIRPSPKQDLINAVVMLHGPDQFRGAADMVPPHRAATANLFFLVHRAVAPQGTSLRVTVGITDQFGHEYRLNAIRVRGTQPRVTP
jgi:hypothetical protein